MIKDFRKLKIHLEAQLMGLGYYRAQHAMTLAQRYHTGLRKNGSPEFQHQVEQALYALTLPLFIISEGTRIELIDIEELIVVIFLHDTLEDYNLTKEDIEFGVDRNVDFAFGPATATRIYGMSKVYRGIKRDPTEVFDAMSKDMFLALAKGCDRVHNHGTMAGAFKLSKIISYIKETKEEILPMLKKARKRFPKVAAAFYNIETILHRDIYMLEQMIERFVNQQVEILPDPTLIP